MANYARRTRYPPMASIAATPHGIATRGRTTMASRRYTQRDRDARSHDDGQHRRYTQRDHQAS